MKSRSNFNSQNLINYQCVWWSNGCSMIKPEVLIWCRRNDLSSLYLTWPWPKSRYCYQFLQNFGKRPKASIFKKESLNMKVEIFMYPHPEAFWNSNILTSLQHPDSLLGFGRQGWHGGSPRRKHLIVFDSKKTFHSDWWIFQYQRNYKFGNPSQFTLELFKCRHQIHILLAKALYLFPEWIHLTVKRCEEWMFVQLLHLIHTLGKPTFAAPDRTTTVYLGSPGARHLWWLFHGRTPGAALI